MLVSSPLAPPRVFLHDGVVQLEAVPLDAELPLAVMRIVPYLTAVETGGRFDLCGLFLLSGQSVFVEHEGQVGLEGEGVLVADGLGAGQHIQLGPLLLPHVLQVLLKVIEAVELAHPLVGILANRPCPLRSLIVRHRLFALRVSRMAIALRERTHIIVLFWILLKLSLLRLVRQRGGLVK